MTKKIWLVPAYGRDYKTENETLEAWKSGKDFYTINYEGFDHYGGRYCSIRDFQSSETVVITIYYSHRNKSVEFNNHT